MSKARGLADLGNAYSDGALSNRNVIINGNFDVWQRGVADVTSDTYFADRWVMSRSGATATASQESFALGQTDVPNNPSFYAKLNVTTGNNQARIEQRVEDVTTFAGQTATLSFYAKGTNPNSGNVEIFLAHRYGTGGSASVNVVDTITLTGNWQRFEVTLDIPSVSGKTIGDGNYVQIAWRQPDTDTSTDAWDISLSQVQLEVGDTATPFEHRSYGDELQRCQRYFYKKSWVGSGDKFNAGAVYDATNVVGSYWVPVPLRAQPSVGYSGLQLRQANTAKTISSFTVSLSNTDANDIRLVLVSSGLTGGQSASFRATGTGYLQFDAEL